jgi:hypothetical protein
MGHDVDTGALRRADATEASSGSATARRAFVIGAFDAEGRRLERVPHAINDPEFASALAVAAAQAVDVPSLT